MNAYRCASCGAAAYSSANSDTVGACPGCGASLADPQPPCGTAADQRLAALAGAAIR